MSTYHTVPERLAALRARMAETGIDWYIVPTADDHQSEYVGGHYTCRRWLTGFTGSAGTALVGKEGAWVWTDGRYFIQAAAQLKGSGFELMKEGQPGVPTLDLFLQANMKAGETLGFDGRCVSMLQGRTFQRIVRRLQAGLKSDVDLVGGIWEDRPEISKKPAWTLDVKYAGETRASKIARIREAMKKQGADIHIVSSLDDICWTLNMRGDDIEYFPLVLAFAVITQEQYILYIDPGKLSSDMKIAFTEDQILIRPYEAFYEDLKKLDDKKVLMIDPKRTSWAVCASVPQTMMAYRVMNPEILMKAVKNETEIANIRKAEMKDSIAHIRFMKWLKENVGKIRITEISASEKLESYRKEMEGYIQPSFDPISSFGPHGAVVHYAPTPETDAEVLPGGMLLTDTGGGYWEGSTDVTRTYVLGEIPDIQKEHFTLTAISNLSLADAKFRRGCTGAQLDILARKPFWDRGLDFDHGTGHGIGYLMNIHEAGIGFRWRYVAGETEAFVPGMLISDEPGIYIEGSHGIRLENDVLVVEDEKNEFGEFLRLEPLTLIPFDLDGIVPEMMSDEQKRLLNDYHKRVFETISPYLTAEEAEWLKKYTRSI